MGTKGNNRNRPGNKITDNLGIGTTEPNSALHVQDSGPTVLTLKDGGADAGAKAYLEIKDVVIGVL